MTDQIETIEVTVASGHIVQDAEDKGETLKVYRAGDKLTLPKADANRLRALGYVTVPEPAANDSESDARSKAGVTISGKGGPRVESKGDAR